MPFSFVHTADWQIGKPFAGFDGERAPQLRQARLDCVDRIADEATKAGAAHVFVAGDVFDSATPPEKLVAQLIGKLKGNAAVTWHLLPGNHDPARAGSVWSSLERQGVPGNVRLHLRPEAVEITPGVVLLPAPLSQASTERDPTAWMDQAVTAAGVMRVGMAHGSVQGNFGGNDGDAKVPIAPDRPSLARLDYLALGDWHGCIRIGDRAWYSGTPEVDRFPDNDPGHILIVHIDGAGAVPKVEPRATSRYAWIKRSARITGPDDLGFIERDIAGLGRAAGATLLQLDVSGAVRLSEHAAVTERLRTLDATLFHVRSDTSALTVLADAEDIAAFAQGSVRSAATRLKTIADSGGADSAAARRALMLLASFATDDAGRR